MINFNMLLDKNRRPNREFIKQQYKQNHCDSCGKTERKNTNQILNENTSKNTNEIANTNEIVNSIKTTNGITIYNYNSRNKLFEIPKIYYSTSNTKKPCGQC